MSVTHGVDEGELILDPSAVESAHIGRHRRARRLLPHPDPVLRAAAAPPRRGVHPRPRRLPHRRPADQLPPGRAAQLRRHRRQAPEGIRIIGARTACTAPRSTLPYPSVGATEQVLLTAVRAEGITELRGRRDRARDHGPHRRPAEDGRDHHGRDRPRHPHRGRRDAAGLHAPRALRPQRGRLLGLRRPRDRRRHLRRRRPQPRCSRSSTSSARSGGDFDIARGRHPLLPPRRRAQAASSSRPTCTPAS